MSLVSEQYDIMTRTDVIEHNMWDEDFKPNGAFAWEPPVLTDKELVCYLFNTGRKETTTGNWIFDLKDLDGRTPKQALALLYRSSCGDFILDAEFDDNTLDIIFALDVCPNAEQEEDT